MNVIKQTQDEHDNFTRYQLFRLFDSGDEISISLIQRKCKVGYNSAYRVHKNLTTEGVIVNGKVVR